MIPTYSDFHVGILLSSALGIAQSASSPQRHLAGANTAVVKDISLYWKRLEPRHIEKQLTGNRASPGELLL